MLRKTENFSVSMVKEGSLSEKCGGVEYKMSYAMAQEIIKNKKGKGRPQEILVNYVNSQMGLKDKCVRVLVDLD
jgi:hypothetical protein